MTHVSEEQLIAFVLEDLESRAREEVQTHLASCQACRNEAAQLRTALEAAASLAVPDRPDDYGAEVWARIAPRLASAPGAVRKPGGFWRLSMAAAAVLLALAGAFLAGRHSREARPDATVLASRAPDAGTIRERVVLAALGDHLDRTERGLLELVNATDAGSVDISAEQAWAGDLLDANRLYRQSVRGTGSPGLSQVLDELEPVLLDIVHSPSRLSGPEFDALRSRIEDRSLVFKLRVSGADVRARQRTLLHSGEKTS